MPKRWNTLVSDHTSSRPEFAPERRERTLWVGNLDKRVNEYLLIKLFTKYGEIVREDFMWNTHGEERGAPRGYAFIEFKTAQEAVAALKGCDNQELCGRNIVVRHAEERQTEAGDTADIGEDQSRLNSEDCSQQKIVSKTKKTKFKVDTDAKIRAIEAKLQQMQEAPSVPTKEVIREDRYKYAQGGGQKVGTCYDFENKGSCLRGETCRYSHTGRYGKIPYAQRMKPKPY